MTEPPTVVLMAMEPEVAALRARMSNVETSIEYGVSMARGDLGGHPVTAVLCGVGKVAAATASAVAAAGGRPRSLISAGVAGGVHADARAGSLLVVTGAVEHDYDLRPFVAQPGHDFGGPRRWEASAEVVAALQAAARLICASREPAVAVAQGWAATGDHVVSDRERHARIRALGSPVACVDMETSAVAYAAAAGGVPWAGLRVISDGADEALDPGPVLSLAVDAGVLLADVLERYLAAQ